MNPGCDPETNSCKTCVRNEPCTDRLNARCDAVQQRCAGCTSDDDCAHLEGAQFCNAGSGVCGECKGPEQCQDPQKPNCQEIGATCVP